MLQALDVSNPLGIINYGFEIEVVKRSPYFIFNLLEDQFNCEREGNYGSYQDITKWNIGDDGTVDAEIRSPVLKGDFSPIFPMLKALRSIGCETNSNCGFHIHISFTPTLQLNAEALQDRFFNLFGQMGWDKRIREYASFTKSKWGRNEKYKAIRQISNDHIEFRMFNGTLNCRAIREYVKMVHATLGY